MQKDTNLGKQVHDHLVSLGLETPMTDKVLRSAESKMGAIEPLMAEIMEILGLDLTDDSLAETPHRVAKMYVNEIFGGLDFINNFPKCTVIENKMSRNTKEFVLIKDITIQSSCEHHFLPIIGPGGVGGCHIAYIPGDWVMGLSKFQRIVEVLARRPQVQERLTQQICAAIQFITGTENVAVKIEAEHLCVKTRGVRDTSSLTSTLATGGVFSEDAQVRAEFLGSCK